MTLTCPACGTVDIELTSFTGGERTAMEFYKCGQCGHEFSNHLTEGGYANA